jgi:hypothetical protein
MLLQEGDNATMSVSIVIESEANVNFQSFPWTCWRKCLVFFNSCRNTIHCSMTYLAVSTITLSGSLAIVKMNKERGGPTPYCFYDLPSSEHYHPEWVPRYCEDEQGKRWTSTLLFQ